MASPMTQSRYLFLFLGLSAIVAALSAVLAYALLRFFAAARVSSRVSSGSEAVFVTAAMEDALRDLRSQERAMKARAEASERLSDEIVASLTSGLLVVDFG